MNKIDKIFHAKLTDFERQPSSRIWEKLNEGLEEKNAGKKKGIFWYSIAAGLIAFIVASFFIINSIQVKNNLSAERTEMEKIEKKPFMSYTHPSNPKAPDPKEQISHPVNTLTVKQKRKAKEKLVKPEVPKFAITENQLIDSSRRVDEQVDIIGNAITSTLAEDVKNSISHEAISVVIKRGNSSVTPPSEGEKSAFKKSKLARVYTQVLNFKNGEKVDLDEFSSLLAINKKEKTNSK